MLLRITASPCPRVAVSPPDRLVGHFALISAIDGKGILTISPLAHSIFTLGVVKA